LNLTPFELRFWTQSVCFSSQAFGLQVLYLKAW
jgi:hypothetical protein